MLNKHLVAGAVIVAMAMPAVALAATAKAKAYYAEQSVKSKMCYVVTFKPDGKHATEIGTSSFDSFAKAAAAIKADKDCKAPMKMKTASAKPKTPAPATKPKG